MKQTGVSDVMKKSTERWGAKEFVVTPSLSPSKADFRDSGVTGHHMFSPDSDQKNLSSKYKKEIQQIFAMQSYDQPGDRNEVQNIVTFASHQNAIPPYGNYQQEGHYNDVLQPSVLHQPV